MQTFRVTKLGVITCMSLLLISTVSAVSSNAAAGSSIALYLSPPLAQGTTVTGGDITKENFNTFTTGDCVPLELSMATMTTAPNSGSCSLNTAQNYGGATFDSSAPSFGGAGSRFPATPWYDASSNPTKSITFSFANPVKYVGFYWTAGNDGNLVEFLDGNTVIASYSSNDLMTFLGNSRPSPYPGPLTVKSIDGSTYSKGHYFGNPRGFTSTSPNSASSIEPNYVFAYLNLFLTGTQTANAVRFSGPGFEFDNLAVGTQEHTPDPSLVFTGSVLGKSVQFFPNGTGVTGSMSVQSDSIQVALTQNAFTRQGFTFLGWNTDPDGLGTPYTDAQLYNFSADLTLYAQWTPVQANSSSTPTPATPTPATPTATAVAAPTLASTGAESSRNSFLALAFVLIGAVVLVARKKLLAR